jgi:hypothetical protein
VRIVKRRGYGLTHTQSEIRAAWSWIYEDEGNDADKRLISEALDEYFDLMRAYERKCKWAKWWKVSAKRWRRMHIVADKYLWKMAEVVDLYRKWSHRWKALAKYLKSENNNANNFIQEMLRGRSW